MHNHPKFRPPVIQMAPEYWAVIHMVRLIKGKPDIQMNPNFRFSEHDCF